MADLLVSAAVYTIVLFINVAGFYLIFRVLWEVGNLLEAHFDRKEESCERQKRSTR